jgi:hypothetical protein
MGFHEYSFRNLNPIICLILFVPTIEVQQPAKLMDYVKVMENF